MKAKKKRPKKQKRPSIGDALMQHQNDMMEMEALKLQNESFAAMQKALAKPPKPNKLVEHMQAEIAHAFDDDTAAEPKSRYENLLFCSLRVMCDLIAKNAVVKGFRKKKPKQTRESVAVFVANLHGEISEYWEAYRDGKLNEPCDKAKKMIELGLPPLTSAEEELADVIIRACDTAMADGIDVQRAIVTKYLYNTTRPFLHGGKRA